VIAATQLENVECGADGCQTDGPENRECFPIDVPDNDPFFGSQSCLMFVRSQGVPNEDCVPGLFIISVAGFCELFSMNIVHRRNPKGHLLVLILGAWLSGSPSFNVLSSAVMLEQIK